SLDLPAGIVAWQTVSALANATLPDVLKRPFITVGFASWLCMLPLALTSMAVVHRLTYVSAAAAVLHYWWLVKADVRRPETYALVVGLLLIFRAWWWGGSARAPGQGASRPERGGLSTRTRDRRCENRFSNLFESPGRVLVQQARD